MMYIVLFQNHSYYVYSICTYYNRKAFILPLYVNIPLNVFHLIVLKL